jgi:catechol 2,3-dioxygenase-like lactoylglutathione lyase family enzyme
MLGDKDVMATIAVKDLAVAKKFYEGTLGLKPVEGREPEVVTYRSGNSMLQVYRSQFAGTNRATAVTWAGGNDVTALVQTLKDKGVDFEHYDLPGLTREGDVHVGRNLKVAWFKDPDGNIISIVGH